MANKKGSFKGFDAPWLLEQEKKMRDKKLEDHKKMQEFKLAKIPDSKIGISDLSKKKKQTENDLTKQVTTYLKLQYPDIIFRHDLGGIKLTIGQAVKVKAINKYRAYPDIFIAEPIGKFNGLFLELKKEGVNLYKKNRDYKDEHIKEQAEMLTRLFEKGYAAYFAIGFSATKELIDNYLKLK